MRALTFGLLLFFGQAFAQDCSCTGQSQDPIENGGDGAPLLWQSMERLYRSGSASWYCYERRVINRSDRDVTDVFWKVAGFEKSLIPKHDDRCDANPFAEGYQQPHPKGRLYFSVGGEFYPTAVYAPQHGFEDSKTASARILPAKDTPDLISVIEVSDRRSGAKGSIRFASSVRTSVKGTDFEYKLSSSGSEPVIVYWYIPLTEEFRNLKMSRNEPTALEPGAPVRRLTHSSDPVGWTAAAVQIFDRDRRWLATGIASAYCSLNGKAEPLLEQPTPRQ